MDFYYGLAADHRRPHAPRPVGLRRPADRPGDPGAGGLLRDRRLCRGNADGARRLGAAAGARGRRRCSARSSPARSASRRCGCAGLMLVVATLAFGEGVRLFFFNFDYQIAARRREGRAARRRRLPPDPLLPRERLDDARGDAVHLDDRRRRDGGAVVVRPLALRRGAARGGRGRARRAVGRRQPDRGEGERDDRRRRHRRHRRRPLRALHDPHRAHELQHPGRRPSPSPTRSSADSRACSARSPPWSSSRAS